MKVELKQRISTKTDRISLYLETYKGYTTTAQGKKRNIKEYETLDYYLYANPKNAKERLHNKEHLRKAEAREGRAKDDMLNHRNGFKSKAKAKTNLVTYFKKLTEERLDSKGNYGSWDSCLKHLSLYCNTEITFENVTAEFIEGFRKYLLTTARTKSGNLLSRNSSVSYFNKFRAAVNQAYADDIISDNPIKKVKGIKSEDTEREYLSFEELQKLVDTECRYEVLKRAFIFSCLTGLRWSDIVKLKWSEVQEEKTGLRIHFKQKKTKSFEYLNLTDQAREYMGEKRQLDDLIFTGLKYSSYFNVALSQWMLRAGITKHITFHCGRHTFAIMQLELGTDIYTIMKLLGHREIKTTQVYVQVLDKAKIEAVNRIPNLKN